MKYDVLVVSETYRTGSLVKGLRKRESNVDRCRASDVDLHVNGCDFRGIVYAPSSVINNAMLRRLSDRVKGNNTKLFVYGSPEFLRRNYEEIERNGAIAFPQTEPVDHLLTILGAE